MSSLKLKEEGQRKQYNCFKCKQPIMFKPNEYKYDKFGKRTSKTFNLNGTEHFCNGSGGSHKEAKQRTRGRKDPNAFWRWYYGFGPGKYHRLNEQRYSSDEYRQRREKAREQYNNYKQQYTNTKMTREEAMTILGLLPRYTAIEVRNAYRRLALMFHPDRNKSEVAPEKFRQATEAYELLTAT